MCLQHCSERVQKKKERKQISVGHFDFFSIRVQVEPETATTMTKSFHVPRGTPTEFCQK